MKEEERECWWNRKRKESAIISDNFKMFVTESIDKDTIDKIIVSIESAIITFLKSRRHRYVLHTKEITTRHDAAEFCNLHWRVHDSLPTTTNCFPPTSMLRNYRPQRSYQRYTNNPQ